MYVRSAFSYVRNLSRESVRVSSLTQQKAATPFVMFEGWARCSLQ